MKNSIWLPFLIILVLFLPGCHEFDPLELKTAEELEEVVRKNRIMEPLEEEEAREKFSEFLYSYRELNGVNPEKIRGQRGTGNTDFSGDFSAEKALKEVDFLFQMLKYGYAGYGFFGGDETFGKAKEEIVKEIKSSSDLSWYGYNQLIFRHLSFINDGHFRLGGERLVNKYYLYLSGAYDFSRDEEGYYLKEEGETFYLDSCNEKEPENYLKLSLNQQGELVYRLGTLYAGDSNSYAVELSFSGDKRADETVYLSPVKRENYPSKVYNYYEEEGIPVVVNRAAWGGEGELKRFTEGAKKLQDAQLAILDIRGHGGGADTYPRHWIMNYADLSDFPSLSRMYIDLCTPTSQAFQMEWAASRRRDVEGPRVRYAPTDDGWSEITYFEPEFIANDRYLIVLMDGNTVSAGESFVRVLRQMENVILVGENTSGATLVGNIGHFFLPYSNQLVQMGVSLFLELDLSNKEGIGFKPDIWVEPGQALDLVLKFVENYLP